MVSFSLEGSSLDQRHNRKGQHSGIILFQHYNFELSGYFNYSINPSDTGKCLILARPIISTNTFIYYKRMWGMNHKARQQKPNTKSQQKNSLQPSFLWFLHFYVFHTCSYLVGGLSVTDHNYSGEQEKGEKDFKYSAIWKIKDYSSSCSNGFNFELKLFQHESQFWKICIRLTIWGQPGCFKDNHGNYIRSFT